jgi:hypothetical protein
MGHTLGFISGYSEFDKYVKGNKFITDTFTAVLTRDGSHLDTTFHPYDLMNTSLKPGVRKLPSALNLAMMNAINSGIGSQKSAIEGITAPLTAGALLAINNGDFSTNTGWDMEGETNIINGSATLTEQSQKLASLTQAFTIPTGAKRLQFTIVNNNLVPDSGNKSPNDAFEVALLDTNTFNPLAGTIALTHSDSLLNIQANGTIHKSDRVTINPMGSDRKIITIDDVKLFTTNQNTTLTFNPIIDRPQYGTLNVPLNPFFTYTPDSNYVGSDRFTYIGFNSDGQVSNLTTVNITINNLPPTIETLTIPNQIKEDQTIELSATAKDGGVTTQAYLPNHLSLIPNH